MIPWTDHDPIWPEVLGKRRALMKPRIRVRRVSSTPSRVMIYCVPLLCLALFVMTIVGVFFTEVDLYISGSITGILTLAAFFWWNDLVTNLSIRRAEQVHRRVSGFKNAVSLTLKEFIRMDSDVSGELWLFTLYGSEDTAPFLNESSAIMVFDDETDAMVFRVSR